MSSEASGGLDSSKVRNNGKQERLKDWGSSLVRLIKARGEQLGLHLWLLPNKPLALY
ncbi:MAG: hypothetical protein V7L20_20075 [Nostoc sp.]|uniref:hypothetical protein n=1 Tax=Nostoc sp. TaxID=1180 RepID=UPI002FF98099